jgi:hypothetical protein
MTASCKLTFDERVPFVRAVLAFQRGTERPDVAAEILSTLERKHGLEIRLVSQTPSLTEGPDDELWTKQVLGPFLTESHFVLTGGDLQLSFDILDQEGVWRLFSWRHWGYIMADWANSHWLPRPAGLGKTPWSQAQRDWEYLDFYSFDYFDYLVEGYAEWIEALGRVVARKNELFGTLY